MATLALLSGLVGGGVATGVLVAVGATDSDSTTTTVVRDSTDDVAQSSASSDGTSESGGALDASALYESTAGGVVSVTATGVSSEGSVTPFGPPADSQTATGSGFVIDAEGYIVTAAHVVDGASQIKVKFQDGTTRTAELLGQDNATDVAVLRVDPSGLDLQPLELGDSSALEEGDAVAAIGDPFGYERSISTGIVSGLERTIEAPNGYTVAHAIQTDASLNPGNSGGPVVNAAGEVVGIADQIATDGSSEDSSGVGFAVPIDLVKSELDQLKAGEQVEHAYLGVGTSTASGATPGALIESVASGSPADDAGLRTGDVVTALGSSKTEDSDDLVAAIAAHQPGDRVRATVRRDSETLEVEITLDTQPDSATSP